MAIPPRVIVFTDSPRSFITIKVIITDIGMDIKDMTVVLQFMRKMKRTIMTKILPSRRDFFTLLMEFWMKSACRKT